MGKKRVTFTLSEELIEQLKEVSEKTMIPQARLVEQAIKKVIEEYKEDASK
jgi:predicted DNA-binding protein